MNKEHWITILLDGTVDKEKIKQLINLSYDLTKSKYTSFITINSKNIKQNAT